METQPKTTVLQGTCNRCGQDLFEKRAIWLELSITDGRYYDEIPKGHESQGYFLFDESCAAKLISQPAQIEKIENLLSKLESDLSVRQCKLIENRENNFTHFVEWQLDEFIKNEFTLEQISILKEACKDEKNGEIGRVRECLDSLTNTWTNELLNLKLTPTNLPYANCVRVSILEAKAETLRLIKTYLSFLK